MEYNYNTTVIILILFCLTMWYLYVGIDEDDL